MIEEVTTDSFSERVTRCDIPVVVDFYAEWCQPCHQIAPALEALAQQHDGAVRFTKVDIEAEPELAAAYRVSSIPAVLRFDSGVYVLSHRSSRSVKGKYDDRARKDVGRLPSRCEARGASKQDAVRPRISALYRRESLETAVH